MRYYDKGETVRLPDESLGKVLERVDGQYQLPEGQAIGGAPGATSGGHAHYRVKTADGETVELRDQDLRNPPKDSGKYTPYSGDPRVAGTEFESADDREARKDANRAAVAKAKEAGDNEPKRASKRAK